MMRIEKLVRHERLVRNDRMPDMDGNRPRTEVGHRAHAIRTNEWRMIGRPLILRSDVDYLGFVKMPREGIPATPLPYHPDDATEDDSHREDRSFSHHFQLRFLNQVHNRDAPKDSTLDENFGELRR